MSLINSLSSGVSALRSFSKGIEVIGNNISNVNTTGFKGARVDYSDSFSQMLSRATGSDGTGNSGPTNQVGMGVQVAKISNAFTQGSISPTGVPTDLAISGNGFFKVVNSVSGTEYATRAGNFRVDDAGSLLNPDGLNLQGFSNGSIRYSVSEVAGELVFTPTDVAPTSIGDMNVNFDLSVGNGISLASSVTSYTAAQVEAAAPRLESYAFDKYGNLTFYLSNGDSFVKGQVLLLNFTDPNALVKEGGNLYTNFEAAGPLGGTSILTGANNTPGTNGLGSFQTNALELSNVDLTEEFANLITTQRSFQAGARIITVSDDILQEIVNLKR
jgi:flagellar hook protein FlgE